LQRIEERAAALGAGGSSSSLWPALAAAAGGLSAGDENVLLGGPAELPDSFGGIPIRRAAAVDASVGPGVVAVRRAAGDPTAVEVDVTTGGGPATVRARDGERVLATAVVDAAADGSARTLLGPPPDDAGARSIDGVPDGAAGGPGAAGRPAGTRRAPAHGAEP